MWRPSRSGGSAPGGRRSGRRPSGRSRAPTVPRLLAKSVSGLDWCVATRVVRWESASLRDRTWRLRFRARNRLAQRVGFRRGRCGRRSPSLALRREGAHVTSNRKIALAAGVLFIVTFVTSIPALYLFQPVLDDPAGYIAGSGADNTRIFVGATLEATEAAAEIAPVDDGRLMRTGARSRAQNAVIARHREQMTRDGGRAGAQSQDRCKRAAGGLRRVEPSCSPRAGG